MSAIEWTDETWNPTVGCSRVSPGCDNCYAVRVAAREMQPAHRGLTVDGDWTGEVRCLPDRLDTPLRWRKPRRVFVDSMSDLFHLDVPDEFIGRVWETMARCPQHTFQVLTKRPQRMVRALGPDGCGFYASERADLPCPQPNVWLGTSVENQRYADLRIPHLLATPAAVRFLSIEPMLGPVALTRWLHGGFGRAGDHDELDWVIIGGESGPGARRMDPSWCMALVEECEAAGVPVFVKQLGSVLAREWGCADRKGGEPGEWPPEFRARDWPLARAEP